MSKPIQIRTRKVLNREKFIEEWIKIMFPSLTNADKAFLKLLMLIYPEEYHTAKHKIIKHYEDRPNYPSLISNNLKSLCSKYYLKGKILYKIRRGVYKLDTKITDYLAALNYNNVTQFVIEIELNPHAI